MHNLENVLFVSVTGIRLDIRVFLLPSVLNEINDAIIVLYFFHFGETRRGIDSRLLVSFGVYFFVTNRRFIFRFNGN